ncbi:MAG: DUF937 domain-containing protein [Pigmentiphaga sp.]|uniref:DUF937 domain-containing protein n=1 Tax=Pigmentiphaga sp. TaxID=1977564 RepID=UPI0029BC154F|nr:DUF937 domain-containing protein [Pigmentiphaga sp.]MDX3905874.1 DUF937 domain-containing protein [Pigmentiphaga sp.]
MNAPTSLSEELMSQLQGAPLQQLAQQLGTDTGQAQQAVSTALPLLLGAMGKNAAQPQGAQALFGALQQDHAGGGGLQGMLGSLLGGAGQGGPAGADGILGHIFGGSQERVENGLGQATGLGSGNAANLLKMLAPIVMAFLAQRVQSGGMTPDSLGATLGQERDAARQQGGGLLDSLLDQNGDGQVGMEDLIKIGGTLFGGRA